MGKSAPSPPPAPNPTQIINAQTGADQSSAVLQAHLNNVNYQGPQGLVAYDYSPLNNMFTEKVQLNPTEQATFDASNQAALQATQVANQQIGRVGSALGQGISAPSFQGGGSIGNLMTGYNPGGAIQTGIGNTPVQTGIANPGAIQAGLGQVYSPFVGVGSGAASGGGSGSGAPASGQSGSAGQGDPHAGMHYDQSSGWIPTTPYGTDPSGAHPGQMYDPKAGWVAADSRAVSPAAAATQAQGAAQAQAAPTHQQLGQELNQELAGKSAARMQSYANWLNSGASALPAAQQQVYDQLAQQHPEYNQAQLEMLSFQPNLQGGPSNNQFFNSLATQGGQGPAQGAGQGSGQGASAPSQPSQGQQQGASGQPDPLSAILSNPVATTQLATYANARQMLDPQWQQATEHQQAQLAAQGLNPNDAAYQNSMQLFGNQENNAYNQAIYDAIGAGNTEQNTLFGQTLNAGQFANNAQLQNYNELMGQAGLYNSASGQAFTQGLQQGQFANSAQLQQNQENAAAAAFNNSAYGQNWQEQYANAQLANQNAQQQFQDQAYAQELPINEFTALMGAGQVGMPPSAPAQNTSVGVPDVTGAYGLQQSALQADYAAKMQNYQSGLGGLFNLGSAALKLAGL